MSKTDNKSTLKSVPNKPKARPEAESSHQWDIDDVGISLATLEYIRDCSKSLDDTLELFRESRKGFSSSLIAAKKISLFILFISQPLQAR